MSLRVWARDHVELKGVLRVALGVILGGIVLFLLWRAYSDYMALRAATIQNAQAVAEIVQYLKGQQNPSTQE